MSLRPSAVRPSDAAPPVAAVLDAGAPAAAPVVPPVVPSATAAPVVVPPGIAATAVVPPSAVAAAARRARVAAEVVATLSRATKDRALLAVADALGAHRDVILAANAEDLADAEASGTPAAQLDRLRLDGARLAAIAADLRQLAALPDPVGQVVYGATLPNGLDLRQVRVPLGVVGMVYEARPNVTVDAAALCLKSGNAVLLRGSRSADRSNRTLVDVIRAALTESGLPADCCQHVPADSRDSVTELMRARGLVDVLIPRGGAELIRTVATGSTVPVIETGTGNCHVYVDADAEVDTAVRVLLDSKASRPSVCNSAETLLVHRDIADRFLPAALAALAAAGVTVHGDARLLAHPAAVAEAASGLVLVPATAADWDTEYLSLDLAAAVVDSLDDAVAHIRRHSSGHTEAIVTASQPSARRFTRLVDAAAVSVNASTRFTDGGQFGFGAEIGISTQRLHARGPIGLTGLTTTKYILTGDGHTR